MLNYATEFQGKKALITGGSRGIGAATAQRLLDGGATVVVTARAHHAQTPAGATFLACDVSTLAGATAVAEEALRLLGGLDILVNNAGAATPRMPSSATITDEDWLDSLMLNLEQFSG